MQMKIIILCFTVLLMATAHAAPPDWSVNVAEFEMSATMTAKLFLDKEPVNSGGNIVGAFVADTCRGVSPALYSMNTWMYFISIYSNKNNETIQFRAYIADLDSVLDITETIVFESNANYGDPMSLFDLNAYYNYDFPPEVSGIPEQTIYSGENFALVRLPDYLTQMDDDSVVWSYRGYSFLDVSIDADYNATITPFFPQWTGTQQIIFTATEQTDNGLCDSDTANYTILPPDHPPQILNIPDQTIGLLGTFETIDLNTYLDESDGDEAVWSYAFTTEPGNAVNPDWGVQPTEFESSMTLTAGVTVRGKAAAAGNYILGAFVVGAGNVWECRGMASPTNVPGAWLYFLTIYSNSNQDSIHFRFFDPWSGEIFPVKEIYAFESNAAWGSPVEPVNLNAGYLLLQISETDQVQIDILDSAWTGSENIEFRVSDSGTQHEYADSAAVTFTVLPDHHPVVRGIPDQCIEQGLAFSRFDLDDYLIERDNETVTWRVQGNVNLNVQVSEANVVTILPVNPDWIGSETIQFIATDNTLNKLSGLDSARFTLLAPDHPPVLSEIPNQTIGIGGHFSVIDLDSYLTEFDGDSIVWRYIFPEPPESVAVPTWTVQVNDFELSMTVTAIVIARGDTINAGNHLLGAFAGEQCRGVASPVNVMGTWIYFLTVHSNTDGEDITLLFYDANNEEIFPMLQQITFYGNASYGAPVQPYRLDAGFLDIEINESNIASVMLIDPAWTGIEVVQFVATDFGTSHQYADSQLVRFTVLTDDHTPLISGIPDQTIITGGQFTGIQLNNYLTESDGDSVIWSASGNAELIVALNGSMAQVSPPDERWFGSETVIFRVTDVTVNGLSDADTVLFTVQRPVPVELSGFSAVNKADGVKITWATASESNNFGFEVQRKPAGDYKWQVIGFHPGTGTTTTPQNYTWFDTPVNPGKWCYRLKQQDVGGQFSYSSVIEITVALPKIFALAQNFPNPFNTSTIIKYELPAGNHWVQLIIYDILGQQIKTLIQMNQQPGYYQALWDGTDESGKFVSSGIYFYKLITGKNNLVRRMVLIE